MVLALQTVIAAQSRDPLWLPECECGVDFIHVSYFWTNTLLFIKNKRQIYILTCSHVKSERLLVEVTRRGVQSSESAQNPRWQKLQKTSRGLVLWLCSPYSLPSASHVPVTYLHINLRPHNGSGGGGAVLFYLPSLAAVHSCSSLLLWSCDPDTVLSITLHFLLYP